MDIKSRNDKSSTDRAQADRQPTEREPQPHATPADAAAPRMADASATIDQVRELLFGETRRTTDQRLSDLDAKYEARLKALNEDMDARFARMTADLAEAQRQIETRRLATVDAIGDAIAQLGATIRNMGNGQKAG